MTDTVEDREDREIRIQVHLGGRGLYTYALPVSAGTRAEDVIAPGDLVEVEALFGYMIVAVERVGSDYGGPLKPARLVARQGTAEYERVTGETS